MPTSVHLIADASSCASPTSQWPYPLLTKREREGRLRFFLSGVALTSKHSYDAAPPETCTDLLNRLTSFEGVEVLAPAVVSPAVSSEIVQRIMPECPNLDVHSEYQPLKPEASTPSPGSRRLSNPYTRNPAFLLQTRADKLAASHLVVSATRNAEYYDLSPYLGSGVWGMFAEGGIIRLLRHGNPDQHIVYDQACIPAFVAISKIIDTKTCAIAADPYAPVNRTISIKYSDADGQFFQLTPNFAAFVDIQGIVYRLSLYSDHTFNGMVDIVTPSHRRFTVFIDRIIKDGADSTLAVKQTCQFTTQSMMGGIMTGNGGVQVPVGSNLEFRGHVPPIWNSAPIQWVNFGTFLPI